MAELVDWSVTDLARPLTDLEHAAVYKSSGGIALLSCILSCVVVGVCATLSTIGLSVLFGAILHSSVPSSASGLFEDADSRL